MGGGGGGGAFSGWHILKYPARLMLKYVYFKKLCLREKCIEVIYIRALSIIIVDG